MDFFFFKQKTAYELGVRLVGSEMFIIDSVWGALGGVVGWFIGLPLGLVLGMIATTFVVEYLRSRDTATAWASTLQALKAFGWTIAIELIAALTSATAWGIGVALAATGN